MSFLDGWRGRGRVTDELATQVIRALLKERLVVRRTPLDRPGQFPLDRVEVRVEGMRDMSSGWLIHEREGGDLTSWRNMLGLIIELLMLDAMKEMDLLENTPAERKRRTAWERITEDE